MSPPSTPLEQVAYDLPRNQVQVVQQASDTEKRMWEEIWLNCARHMGQWEIISDYGRTQHSVRLLLQAYWKIGDWNRMKDAVMKNTNQDTLLSTLYQSYVCCNDVKPIEVESRYRNCVQLALKQWNSLPSLLPTAVSWGRSTCRWIRMGSPDAHWELLCQFQQVVEIHDSAKILKEMQGMRTQVMSLFRVGSLPYSHTFIFTGSEACL
jgi:hypothetical protein